MKREPQEFTTKDGKCFLCQRDPIIVTLLKASHVPNYAWVCEACREEWVGE